MISADSASGGEKSVLLRERGYLMETWRDGLLQVEKPFTSPTLGDWGRAKAPGEGEMQRLQETGVEIIIVH